MPRLGNWERAHARSQYREVQAFSQFASDLDKATQAQLQRGARMVELLKQPQYEPMPVEKQVLSVFAGFNGYLDDLPVASIRRFEIELHSFMAEKYPDTQEQIRTSGQLSDATQATLRKGIEEFKSSFAA